VPGGEDRASGSSAALAGVRVLELGGIGPAPFAGMMLAELGADVVRVDPVGTTVRDFADPREELLHKGKRSVALNLKAPADVTSALAMIENADVLIEGFRPGVAERLGLGPDACADRNPRLVYGRMTGWGQTGPLAPVAGHDVDYIAVTGLLHAMGPAGAPPTVPLNLVGDFGGGALYLVVGVLAALNERQRSGLGQIIDAAIVDGAAHLSMLMHSMLPSGDWTLDRQANLLDGGAPFYGTYETSDGRYLALGAIEPKFYTLLLAGLGIADDPAHQHDRARWPALRGRIAAAVAARTLAAWREIFDGTDACVAAVATFEEASRHPHAAARDAYVEAGGIVHPAPAPRFSRSAAPAAGAPPRPGEHTAEVLREWTGVRATR
jgi:alpha-methylacyl-CoA racemase